jgi:DNA gyrase subunit A
MRRRKMTEEGNTEIEDAIIERFLEEEMKTSYINYSMSVIVQRALPDVKDGLKPVHRRIIYSMYESGSTADKPYKKSARIVGDVLGKYHPHGDTAVYDSMVRMAQDFSLRYPLIDGQGNFGSIDGDNAAAMRYTESRMAKIASEIIADIDKNTVDFMPNYDGTLEEPKVMPTKLPNLLINGSSGIAVGMATNIPPHNLSEVVDALIAQIDDPSIALPDLLEIIKGPDFPTGGTIYGISGIVSAYTSGRGLVRVRSKVTTEDMGNDRTRLVITEIPYQVNKSNLIETIANNVKDKKIEGISDLRDESDREGLRIVVELKRDANEEVVLNQLYVQTPMESTFGIINLALVDNQPKLLSLKQMLQLFISHRKDVIRRRTIFELDKAEKRLHILKGLLIALDNIDAIIKLLRRARSVEDARNDLMAEFKLTIEQAKAILEMRLQKLTSLESEKIHDEHNELVEKIKELKRILESDENILQLVKEELIAIKSKYGDERRTEIITEAIDLEIEDLIADEEVVVTITNTGYVKRLPITTYRSQRRGGKGLKGHKTKEEDFVTDLFITSTHSQILFFTNRGKVFWLKAFRIPEGGRYSKGKPIVNILPRLEEGERIQAMIPVREFEEGQYVVFATEHGVIKKTELIAFSRPRADGIWAIKLDEGDELVNVKLSDGNMEIIVATADGLANRFHEIEARDQGRFTRGVRGIRLRKEDKVIGMSVLDEDSVLLTVTENGYGKRSRIGDYRRTHRGGQGVKNLKVNDKTGRVVTIRGVLDDEELMITSLNGMVIRTPVKDISILGRATQGVRIMNMNEGDKIVAVARLAQIDSEDNGNGNGEKGEENNENDEIPESPDELEETSEQSEENNSDEDNK